MSLAGYKAGYTGSRRDLKQPGLFLLLKDQLVTVQSSDGNGVSYDDGHDVDDGTNDDVGGGDDGRADKVLVESPGTSRTPEQESL